MSDDTHIDGHDEEMDFEREDLTPKPILLFLLALIVGCVLVALVLRGMYRYLESYESDHQPVQSPLVPQSTADTRNTSPNDIAKFPEPRLESNERSEINDFRIREEETLNTYGWVDQPGGAVRIPIERAMQLVAQRGLPTRPQTGAAPTSDVNTAREAARKSDVSGKPAKRK
jgi:hypothetical protein